MDQIFVAFSEYLNFTYKLCTSQNAISVKCNQLSLVILILV